MLSHPTGRAKLASAGPATDLEGLRRELVEMQALRAEQEARMEGMARLFRDLHEQVRRTEHLREIQAEVEARSLEQVEFLRSRMEGEFFQRVESLAAAFEESRRSHRHSSSTVASVVRRMEARLQDVVGQSRSGQPEGNGQESGLELPSHREEELLARLEALETLTGELSQRQAAAAPPADPEALGTLEARLQALETLTGELSQRQAAAAPPADPEALGALEARLQALESLTGELSQRQAAAMPAAELEELQERLELLASLTAELSQRQAASASATGLEELQERLELLASLTAELSQRQAASASATGLEALEDRLEALEFESGRLGPLEERLSGLPDFSGLLGRLEALESLSERLERALPEALAPLHERFERLPEEVQGLVDGLDFAGLTRPLIRRLDELAEEVSQCRRLAEDSELAGRVETLEALGLAARLDRVEGEMRRHAERLDEELEAVFEQNRLRVAEMTDAFDERMALLENAAERVRELEEATLRSRSETGRVLQAAFERMEALTGKMGRLEDQFSAAPRSEEPELLHELRGAVTHLESRMHFLEASPRHLVPATPEAHRFSPSGAGGEEEDPQEGLAMAGLHGLAPGQPGARLPVPEVTRPDFEALDNKIQDVELRLVEQALEALTESRLLREEYERIAHHLSELSENLNQHFGAIWDRLEES